MAGFIESLVAFWRDLTGSLPAKTYKPAKQSKSRKVLFWDFAYAALADLSLQDQPVAHHIRSAIDRLQKQGERPAP
jgi:hypothetical protein